MMALSADTTVDSLVLRCRRMADGLVDPETSAARARRALEPGVGVEVACRRAVTALLLEALPEDRGAARRQLGILWAGEVLRWCRWLGGRRLEPEDLAQEILLGFMAKAEHIEDHDAAEAWLRRVTHRRVAAEARRAWLRRVVPLAGEPPDPRPDAEAATDRAQRLALVRTILDEQRLAHREVLVLHYMEGLSRAEISRQLGLPPGTLNRRLTRARADFERRARRLGLDPALPDPEEQP